MDLCHANHRNHRTERPLAMHCGPHLSSGGDVVRLGQEWTNRGQVGAATLVCLEESPKWNKQEFMIKFHMHINSAYFLLRECCCAPVAA